MRWGDLLYLSSVGLPAVKKEIRKSGIGDAKGENIQAVVLEEDSEGVDGQDG